MVYFEVRCGRFNDTAGNRIAWMNDRTMTFESLQEAANPFEIARRKFEQLHFVIVRIDTVKQSEQVVMDSERLK